MKNIIQLFKFIHIIYQYNSFLGLIQGTSNYPNEKEESRKSSHVGFEVAATTAKAIAQKSFGNLFGIQRGKTHRLFNVLFKNYLISLQALESMKK